MTVKLGKNSIAPRGRKFARAPPKIDWTVSKYNTLIFIEVVKFWFLELFFMRFDKN